MDEIFEMTGLDGLFDGCLDGVFIAGIGMDDIPFCFFRHGLPLTREMMPFTTTPPTASKIQMKIPTINTHARTMSVLLTIWLFVGHTTFFSSLFISRNQRLRRLPARTKKFSFFCFCHDVHPFYSVKITASLRLGMDSVLLAESAILLHFQTIGVILLFFMVL